MSQGRSANSRQLRTLERWRSMELEDAQKRHSALVKMVDEKKAVLDRIQREISDAQAYARERLSEGALSVEALGMHAHFAGWQAAKLSIARAALSESQSKAEEAHTLLLQKFEQRSVVARLRERRGMEASKDGLRATQGLLDELALTRCSGPTGQRTKRGE